MTEDVGGLSGWQSDALEFLRVWQEEQQERAAQPAPDTLYHYTDVAGLMSILRTDALWATSAIYMNDESELLHSLLLLRQLLDPESCEADAVAATVAENFLHYSDIYLVCFCVNGDLLSQWRGYGAGSGYAVGFSSGALTFMPPTGRVMLAPVSYDEEQQGAELVELVQRWRQVFRDGPSREDDPAGWKLAGLLFAECFALLAVRSKKRAFEEEREWRLVFRRLPMIPEQSEEPGEGTVEFRHRHGMPLPYVPLRFRDGQRLPATEVIVGPTRSPQAAGYGIAQFLMSLGSEQATLPVSHSAVPLRPA